MPIIELGLPNSLLRDFMDNNEIDVDSFVLSLSTVRHPPFNLCAFTEMRIQKCVRFRY
jgi:hypothetical protein